MKQNVISINPAQNSTDSATRAQATNQPQPAAQLPSFQVQLPDEFVTELQVAVRVAVKQAVETEIAKIVQEEIARYAKTPVASFLRKVG